MPPSRFEADLTNRRKLRGIAKRYKKTWQRIDPTNRRKKARRYDRRAEAAGLMEPSHYFPGGVPSYCMCGTVEDHNQTIDKLMEDE